MHNPQDEHTRSPLHSANKAVVAHLRCHSHCVDRVSADVSSRSLSHTAPAPCPCFVPLVSLPHFPMLCCTHHPCGEAHFTPPRRQHHILTSECHNFGWWMDWLDAISVSTCIGPSCGPPPPPRPHPALATYLLIVSPGSQKHTTPSM